MALISCIIYLSPGVRNTEFVPAVQISQQLERSNFVHNHILPQQLVSANAVTVNTKPVCSPLGLEPSRIESNAQKERKGKNNKTCPHFSFWEGNKNSLLQDMCQEYQNGNFEDL